MFAKKGFAFSVDCKSLESSIKKAVSVIATGSFFLCGYRKSLCVVGLGTDAFVLISVANSKVDVEGNIFAFSAEHLTGLIKGRSIMDFQYAGTECSFKQVKGNYSGKIPTLNVTADQISQIEAKLTEKSSGTPLTPAALARIKASLAATSIKDVYQNVPLVSYISLTTDGRLVVSSFDAQHFGMSRSKVEGGSEFRAALPVAHFSMVDSIADGTEAKFSVSSKGLRVVGKGFVVCLPSTQADDKHFSMVASFVKALPEPEYEASVDVAAITAVTNNLFTLYSTNANFGIECSAKQIAFNFTTSSGSASDSAQVSGKGKAKLGVDPRLFIDILNLSKACKDVKLSVTNKVVSITGKTDALQVFLACSRTE